MKKSTLARIFGVALLVVAAAAVWSVTPGIQAQLARLPDRMRALGPWGPVLLALVYIPASVLLVPGSLVTMLGAFALGFARALVAVSIGSTLGASASFLVSRYLLRGWVERKLMPNARFRAIDRAVAGQGFKIVLFTRLSPLLPFGPLNYAFGLTGIPLASFALASWLGMLPGTVMYVYFGAAAKRLADITSGNVAGGAAQQALFFVGLATTIAVTVLITRLATQALRAAVDEEGP